MLKNLLNSCFDAYRGSHKSVVAGRHIATDISFPTGYENVNATTYVPPCDGVFVIQCEPAEGYVYYNPYVTCPVLNEVSDGATGGTGNRRRWLEVDIECHPRILHADHLISG